MSNSGYYSPVSNSWGAAPITHLWVTAAVTVPITHLWVTASNWYKYYNVTTDYLRVSVALKSYFKRIDE